MLALISPNTMESLLRNNVRAYSKSGKFSSMEGRRYALMSGVCLPPATILQITKFGMWKHVALMLHTFGQSQTNRTTLTCALTESVVVEGKHTTSYPNLL